MQPRLSGGRALGGNFRPRCRDSENEDEIENGQKKSRTIHRPAVSFQLIGNVLRSVRARRSRSGIRARRGRRASVRVIATGNHGAQRDAQ